MNLEVPCQPLTVTDMEPDWGPLEDRVLRGPSGGFLVGKEKKNNRELWGRASGAEDRGAPSRPATNTSRPRARHACHTAGKAKSLHPSAPGAKQLARIAHRVNNV